MVWSIQNKGGSRASLVNYCCITSSREPTTIGQLARYTVAHQSLIATLYQLVEVQCRQAIKLFD
ncbi:MAG: hypothetical protein ACI8XU_000592 [Kiritimatiellia bacterium]|jgi:hypothetical protein